MADAANTIFVREEGSEPPPRRRFLRTLITAPAAAFATHKLILPTTQATPEMATKDALWAYNEFLFYERRLLLHELVPDPYYRKLAEAYPPTGNRSVDQFFFPSYPASWRDQPAPATRAVAVMAAAGCDWRRP